MSHKKISHAVSEPLLATTPALLHSIPDTARLMGTTTFAVRILCRSGRLKYIALGHRWLISLEAIQRFIRTAERAA
jgi:hypothetical protein